MSHAYHYNSNRDFLAEAAAVLGDEAKPLTTDPARPGDLRPVLPAVGAFMAGIDNHARRLRVDSPEADRVGNAPLHIEAIRRQRNTFAILALAAEAILADVLDAHDLPATPQLVTTYAPTIKKG